MPGGASWNTENSLEPDSSRLRRETLALGVLPARSKSSNRGRRNQPPAMGRVSSSTQGRVNPEWDPRALEVALCCSQGHYKHLWIDMADPECIQGPKALFEQEQNHPKILSAHK